MKGEVSVNKFDKAVESLSQLLIKIEETRQLIELEIDKMVEKFPEEESIFQIMKEDVSETLDEAFNKIGEMIGYVLAKKVRVLKRV